MNRSTAIVAGGLVVVAIVVGGIFIGVYRGGDGESLANPRDAELVALGKTVYGNNCAACHGVALEGQEDWRSPNADGRFPAPPHDESGHTWHHDDLTLFELTKFGPSALAGAEYQSDMPAYKDTLTDRQIWAVLAYIKSRWPTSIRERQQQVNERARERRQ